MLKAIELHRLLLVSQERRLVGQLQKTSVTNPDRTVLSIKVGFKLKVIIDDKIYTPPEIRQLFYLN